MAGRQNGNCGLYNGPVTDGVRLRPLVRPFAKVKLLLIWLILTAQAVSAAPSVASKLEINLADNQLLTMPEWNNPLVPQTCHPIDPGSICADMPYNYTTMPNLLGQEYEDAKASLIGYNNLIGTNCSMHLRFFLCSVYVPMCTQVPPVDSIVVVPPCRPLCLEVKKRCEPILQNFSYPWPPALACDKFPESNENDNMCMPGAFEPSHSATTPETSTRVTASRCGHPEGAFVFLNSTQSCALSCNANLVTTKADKVYVELFHGLIAASMFICVLIVACMYVCRSARVSPEEKPTYFILLCLAVVSCGYVIRLIGGREMGCAKVHLGNQEVISYLVRDRDGLEIPGCIVIFISLYYFGMAANIWWVVLTVMWYSSAVKSRSQKYISRLLTRAHVLAWILPVVPTIAALVAKVVDSDELVAVCFVGQQNPWNMLMMVLGPLMVITAIGSAVLLVGFVNVKQQKCLTNITSADLKASKYIRPPSVSVYRGLDERLFGLCMLYLPSTFIVIACYVVEFLSREDRAITVPSKDRIPVGLYFVRVTMQFIYAVVVTMWFCWTAKSHNQSSSLPKKVTGKHLQILPPRYEVAPSISQSYDHSFYPSESNLYASIGADKFRHPSHPPTESSTFVSGGHFYNSNVAKHQQLANPDVSKRSQHSMAADGHETFV